jgi:hypothetical protein
MIAAMLPSEFPQKSAAEWGAVHEGHILDRR